MRWHKGCLVNKSSGRRVKAILPVHILGHPVDMEPVLDLAEKYALTVIEDASESLGARYKSRMAGSLGHAGCYSFNGNKTITCGSGGMIVTNDGEWARKAKYLSTQAKDDPVEYVHGQIGYNYRMSNIQAAMGCAQLEMLDQYVATKRCIAENYHRGLREVPGIQRMREASWALGTYWLYTILVDSTAYGRDRRSLHAALKEAGVQTRPLWQPLHRSPAHRRSQAFGCHVADSLSRDALSLPVPSG